MVQPRGLTSLNTRTEGRKATQRGRPERSDDGPPQKRSRQHREPQPERQPQDEGEKTEIPQHWQRRRIFDPPEPIRELPDEMSRRHWDKLSLCQRILALPNIRRQVVNQLVDEIQRMRAGLRHLRETDLELAAVMPRPFFTPELNANVARALIPPRPRNAEETDELKRLVLPVAERVRQSRALGFPDAAFWNLMEDAKEQLGEKDDEPQGRAS